MQLALELAQGLSVLRVLAAERIEKLLRPGASESVRRRVLGGAGGLRTILHRDGRDSTAAEA